MDSGNILFKKLSCLCKDYKLELKVYQQKATLNGVLALF